MKRPPKPAATAPVRDAFAPRLPPGKFVVLEGLDCAGKTTQMQHAVAAMVAAGVPALSTRQPSDRPTGKLIRQMLTEQIKVPFDAKPWHPGDRALALLFAADRLDLLDQVILPALGRGTTVLCDRHYHSNAAYQGLQAEGRETFEAKTLSWIKEINARARRPDLVVVLDIDGELALTRMTAKTPDVLERDHTMHYRRAGFYRGLHLEFPSDKIVHLDAAGTEAEVTARLLAVLRTAQVLP